MAFEHTFIFKDELAGSANFMKAVCHYCKDKKLAEQSKNLCVDCFNAIVRAIC